MDTTLLPATDAPTTPSLAVLGGTDRDFSEAVRSLRDELAPTGLVEALLVDRLVVAVSRMRSLVGVGGDAPASGEPWARAEAAMDRALDALLRARSARAEGWGRPAPTSSRIGDVASCPPLPCRDEPAPVPAAAPAGTPSPATPEEANWRDRLVFDEHVSDESPVVRGTWITAGQVVSLLVDGMSRDAILRAYPELTEQDIRACLAYAVEQDGPIAF